MNDVLKKEIIKHIFYKFAIFASPNMTLKSSDFLTDKKISFEIDGKQYQNSVWAGESEINSAKLQYVLADLTEESAKEYCLLLKLDGGPSHIIRWSLDEEDDGSFYIRIQNIDNETGGPIVDNGSESFWIRASTLNQAGLLVAVESLFGLMVSWKKSDNYIYLYNEIIDFLKFESEENV